MLHFSLCNKKRLAIRHTNRPLFPTTLSIPSYTEKFVRLRNYQHPLVNADNKVILKLILNVYYDGERIKPTQDRIKEWVFEKW
jgi:hypothetical protein